MLIPNHCRYEMSVTRPGARSDRDMNEACFVFQPERNPIWELSTIKLAVTTDARIQ